MKKSLFLPVIFVFVGLFAAGQTTDDSSKFKRAQLLREGYRFNEAISLYKEILSQGGDSVYLAKINSLITQSENGLNMLQYANRPIVNAKTTIPSKDFYLYYPGSLPWHSIPDSVSGDTNKYVSVNPAFVMEGQIFFSAPNKESGWDIMYTHIVDGNVWSFPKPLEGPVNSAGNELFPVVSSNGKKLYFSSDGHFGIGGYDLYMSEWDDAMQQWSLPQNLGFPYSSLANDLLLVNSSDGNYTYFVSDRETGPADSLVLYRLDFETTPVKRAVSSIEEAKELAALKVVSTNRSMESDNTRDVMTSPETREYTQMILEVRRIQMQIDSINKNIAANRAKYSGLDNPQEKSLLEKKITEDELSVLNMQSLLRSANEVVQKREMEFLSKGTLIPRREEFIPENKTSADTLPAKEPLQVKPAELLPFPAITLLPPIELFDYTFSVAQESEMAEDQELPQGIVYRIQLFAVASRNNSMKAFKGLRPIFESRNSSGRYIYYAGQFYNYNEAAEALATVRRSGFPSAYLAAYNNGSPVSVRNARSLESKAEVTASYQIISEGYPAGIPQPVLDLLRSNTDKDIAKKVVDGRDIYYIGPYETKQEAEQIVQLLQSIGAEKVSVEEIAKEQTN
ncbi:MAG: hypothetical protein AB7D08_07450 [Bacteroidales bacterium]